MKGQSRKPARIIRTRTGIAHDAQNPHCKFFALASLELKRMVCSKVRASATKRLEEMDKQLAEIDQQQARLLRGMAGAGRGRTARALARRAVGNGEPPPARFVLKY